MGEATIPAGWLRPGQHWSARAIAASLGVSAGFSVEGGNRLVVPGADDEAIAAAILAHEADRLAAAIRRRCRAIDADRDVRVEAPIEVDGIRFDADRASREKIAAVVTVIAAGSGPETIGWTDADNVDRTRTAAGMVALAGALVARADRLHRAARAHKAALRALETLDAVEAYDATGGWDDDDG